MRCVRRILKIKWCDVVENKITNISVCNFFNNISTIEYQIVKRRLNFLGKIIRLTSFKIPSGLLSIFYSIKRSLGRPKYTVRHSMLNGIKKITPEVDTSDSFNTWAHIANDKPIWSILLKIRTATL